MDLADLEAYTSKNLGMHVYKVISRPSGPIMLVRQGCTGGAPQDSHPPLKLPNIILIPIVCNKVNIW